MTKKKDRSPPRARKRGAAPFVVVAGLAAMAAFVWAVAGSDDEAPGRAGLAEDPGVAHVHGLGVNPTDDSLYVATHTGTFRIPDQGQAERVGASFQDTMGFTVAGPDRFLGSGHPDVPGRQAGQPARLGLIESTDAGQTWLPLSLSGDADFHGLAFAHERVYGWDATSGRFMVSEDLSTWDTRSTLQLLGFAVSPTDPDHVVGAGPNGLIDSADGGRTWRPLDGPGSVALSWNAESGLWAVEPDGSVHRRREAGSPWEQPGRLPGEPEAMLARGGVLYAAALEDGVTGIYRSDDAGATWSLIYRDEQ